MGTNSNKNLASELGLITPKGQGGANRSESHNAATNQSLVGTPFESLANAPSADPYSVAHSIRAKSGDHSHDGVSHVADPYSVAHSIRAKSGDHSHDGVSHVADPSSIAHSIRASSEDRSHNSASHAADHSKGLNLTNKELDMIGTPFSTLAVESAMARSENHHASAGVKSASLAHGTSNAASHSASHGVSESGTQSKALNLTDKELGMIGTPFSTLAVESAMARSEKHHASTDSHSNSVAHSHDAGHSIGQSKGLNLTNKELDMIGTPFSTLAVESAMARSASHGHSAQDVGHNASSSASHKLSHGESLSNSSGASVSYGVSESSGVSVGASSGHSHGGSHSSGSGISHSESHGVGIGAVESAVKGHLHSQGVSSAESHFVSSSVSSSLSESLSKGTAASMGSHINFHKEGEAAVSVGHAIGSHEGTSVSMSTLQSVHDHGMPTKGISAIRENLGAEVSKHSDLQVVDKVGHDVTRAIGEQGFPSHEVSKLSQEAGSSKLEALQAIGDHARSNAQESHQPTKVAEQQREM